MAERYRIPLGYARFGDLSSAVIIASTTPTAGTAYSALSSTPKSAIFRVETKAVRRRTDGTSPTSAEGVLFDAATIIEIEDDPDLISKSRFIETSASAALTVEYYK